MTRKGHMYSPLKVFRKWQRKTPKQMRRYAVASCVAATSVPSLVSARGHHVANVPQIPLVINSKSMNVIQKTKQAVYFLKKVGAYADVLKVIASKTSRAGQGKMRGRLTHQRKGPLIVYDTENVQALRAFRNIPGVESCRVDRLSVLKLAPGGHMGRFVIWTESAFNKLNHIFGTTKKMSAVKKGFKIPSAQMAVPDLKRVIKAAEKSGILRAKKEVKKAPVRHNPLRNWAAMIKLNPYAAIAKNRMHQIQAVKAQAKAAYAEKMEKVLAAKAEAVKEAAKIRAADKPKRENGKLVRVKVANNLVKPVVKRTEKQEAYMKKYDGIKKAQLKTFNKKIAL